MSIVLVEDYINHYIGVYFGYIRDVETQNKHRAQSTEYAQLCSNTKTVSTTINNATTTISITT
jgi:hypothetical protein